ncbi:MAG: PilZ domain-containing protein [Terriglobales bacterium]
MLTQDHNDGDVERTVDLRQTKRYYLQATVLYSWKDARGPANVAEGMTRDISVQGIFVNAPECPAAAQHLSIDVLLPSLRQTAQVRLHGEGVVLRVDYSESKPCGFAVVTRLHFDTREFADVLRDVDEESGRVQ